MRTDPLRYALRIFNRPFNIRYVIGGSRNCSCQQLNDWTTTVRATDKERVKKYTTLFSPLYSWCLLYWLFKRWSGG